MKQRSVEQLKNRVTNVEDEYPQIRTRMNITGEDGAKKIMGIFEFFHALDEVLGSRHGVNPASMTIESTAIIPSETSVDIVKTADKADVSQEVESEIPSDGSRPLASSVASAQGKADRKGKAPITADKALVKADSKGKTMAKRKTKQAQRDPVDVVAEDSGVKQVCEMWKLPLNKQKERFLKTMEVQEEAIRNQTTQTKLLVDGLKDMIKAIMK